MTYRSDFSNRARFDYPAGARPLRIASRVTSIALAVLATTATPAGAHEGHDHEEEVAATAMPGGPARNVAELSSELYEALVESHGDHVDIYLDRFETNEPVSGAKLTLAVGDGAALPVAEEAPGTYSVGITPIAAGTTAAITITIDGPLGQDLLGGALEIAAEPGPELGARLTGWIAGGWRWALAILALLAGAALALRIGRSRRADRTRGGLATAVAGVATCTAFVLGAAAAPVQGHEGHDHEEQPAAPGANRPLRLPDGSVFVPKPTQRILELRTQVAAEGATPLSLRLAGEIVGDPRASAVLQTLQGGRVAGGAGGWPVLGATVRRGQVLLKLTPSGSGGERASAAAESARVRAELEQAEAELARVEGLPGIVSRAEIAAARTRVRSLRAQQAALGSPLAAGGEALASPIDGIVAAIDTQPGAVVAPGEPLIRVIDPARLSVEALAFEPLDGRAVSATNPSGIARASVALRDGTRLEATLEGVGAHLRGGAIPVRLNLTSVAPGLSVGQPVVVFLERRASGPGLQLPVEALVRLPSGERVVFEKVAAERFVPRTVRVRPVAADRIAVLSGLEADARVVVRGAGLVAQIR
jgi:hypothetical protein